MDVSARANASAAVAADASLAKRVGADKAMLSHLARLATPQESGPLQPDQEVSSLMDSDWRGHYIYPF